MSDAGENKAEQEFEDSKADADSRAVEMDGDE